MISKKRNDINVSPMCQCVENYFQPFEYQFGVPRPDQGGNGINIPISIRAVVRLG